MRLALAALLVAALAVPAHAGMSCDEDIPYAVADLEDLAKDAKNPVDGSSEMCLPTAFVPSASKALQARIGRACAKILARDGGKQHLCLGMAARLEKKELGGVVIADAMLALKIDPFQYGGVTDQLWTLTMIGEDAKATQKILDVWESNRALAKKRAKNHAHMANWSRFRQNAATMIGKLGTRDQIAFLQQESAATTDKYLLAAIKAAIADIEKRFPDVIDATLRACNSQV